MCEWVSECASECVRVHVSECAQCVYVSVCVCGVLLQPVCECASVFLLVCIEDNRACL